jgi:hypothetical protein
MERRIQGFINGNVSSHAAQKLTSDMIALVSRNLPISFADEP